MKVLKIAVLIIVSLSLPVLSQSLPEPSGTELSDVREVVVKDGSTAVSPLPSPSGKFIAFTADNFKGISLLSLEDGKVTGLSNLQGAGFGFEWAHDRDLLAFRGSLGDLRRKHFIGVAHPDGTVETSSPLLDSLSLPVWNHSKVCFAFWGDEPRIAASGPTEEALPFEGLYLCDPSGRLSFFDNEMKLSKSREMKSEKVFFLPRYAADGKHFIVHCLDGHIYLASTGSNDLKDIGEGSSARFARKDTAVIFERTLDDGHRILASDIYLHDIASGKTFALTSTPDRIEMRPSMAEDGHTVFFDLDGKIMKGWLR